MRESQKEFGFPHFVFVKHSMSISFWNHTIENHVHDKVLLREDILPPQTIPLVLRMNKPTYGN